ncbi:uncharacterized protein LOC123672058 [Harmonia axyridis]|uniref:uncharacterized protein LOC123672058 n=1 Tax=Harmonia axyridis TaxID=115357 RepID=UPI001E2778BC|nr:uncharacterized protein LOC123672058 [Harmonia axyridis]XP_045461983.1 uncharacterized protein LOC123672058 [Harmonia axyridis]
MLSYMLPSVEEKPLAELDGFDGEEGGGKFELALINEGKDARKGDSSGVGSIGKDASFNSFLSDATTATVSHSSMTNTSLSDKTKHKFINGGKPHPLKRVSFGSSHGSMVETLIFESPVQEEIVQINHKPNGDCSLPFQEEQDQTETEREKVRVKFFQQLKPQEVDLPPNELDSFEEDYHHLLMAATVAISDSNHHFQRNESVESGWENPFRPGGDLSREADEIVQMIKGGKPITPTSGEPHHNNLDSSLPEAEQNLEQNHLVNNVSESPEKKQIPSVEATPKSANGNVNKTDVKTDSSPGAVDVKRATVKPDGDASQVEHITIKKKPKCKCCVIQ